MPLNNREYLLHTVNEHDRIMGERREFRVFGTFLIGDQNYGIGKEFAPVKTVTVMVPGLDQMLDTNSINAYCGRNINGDILMRNDIRDIFCNMEICDIKCLEMFCSDYVTVSAGFYYYYEQLKNRINDIARWNEERFVSKIYREIETIFTSFCKTLNVENPESEILKTYGYDTINLSEIIRYSELLGKYIKGLPFKECIKVDDPKFINSVRSGQFRKEIALNVARAYMKAIKDDIARFENQSHRFDEDIKIFLDDLLADIVLKYLIRRS